MIARPNNNASCPGMLSCCSFHMAVRRVLLAPSLCTAAKTEGNHESERTKGWFEGGKDLAGARG